MIFQNTLLFSRYALTGKPSSVLESAVVTCSIVRMSDWKFERMHLFVYSSRCLLNSNFPVVFLQSWDHTDWLFAFSPRERTWIHITCSRKYTNKVSKNRHTYIFKRKLIFCYPKSHRFSLYFCWGTPDSVVRETNSKNTFTIEHLSCSYSQFVH